MGTALYYKPLCPMNGKSHNHNAMDTAIHKGFNFDYFSLWDFVQVNSICIIKHHMIVHIYQLLKQSLT